MMQAVNLFFLLSLSLTYALECDNLGVLIYEDLGCVPEHSSDTTCPNKYSCKGLDSSDKNCYFRGKSYKDGEIVESSASRASCNERCMCREGVEGSSFTCAILDCPEWLGVPVQRDCYRKYALDSCCSVGQICLPHSAEKCAVGGKQHREGDKFYPPNTCLDCVCQKGFTGKLEEPFCKRRSCGDQLRRSSGSKIKASCGAFYGKTSSNEKLCCPNDWICPDGTEVVKGEAKSEDTCNFGEKKIKLGQYFEKANFTDIYGKRFDKVTCECVVAPLMKCVA